jgi:hypothetical protein
MNRNTLLYFFALLIITACEEVQFPESAMTGLWQQVEITEDNVPMPLSAEQKTLQLLIEPNGVYRYNHQSFAHYNGGQGPTTFFGTWNITDDRWVNFTTEKWQLVAALSNDSGKVVLTYKVNAQNQQVIDTTATVQKQWTRYHIPSRFSIIKLTNEELEIRLRTFVGEKRYALLFSPDPKDFVELNVAPGRINYAPKLLTEENYWEVFHEFRTLKTYHYKFRKISN